MHRHPGGVGNPTVRARAWWAVVEGDRVERRMTDHDTATVSAEMSSSGFPRTGFADELIEPWTIERLLEVVG